MAEVVRNLERREGGAPRCPLCRSPLDAAAAPATCDACGVSYHRGCFDELGGCAILGCPRLRPAAPRGPARRPRPPVPGAALDAGLDLAWGGVAVRLVAALAHTLASLAVCGWAEPALQALDLSPSPSAVYLAGLAGLVVLWLDAARRLGLDSDDRVHDRVGFRALGFLLVVPFSGILYFFAWGWRPLDDGPTG